MKTSTKVGKHKLSLRISNAVKSRVKVLPISIKTSQRACIAITRTSRRGIVISNAIVLLGGR
jgi:hypothetical protein